MKPHVERLQAEVFDLNDKINKLEVFTASKSPELISLTDRELELLGRQYEVMQEYFEIVSARFVIELCKENRK